jgi:flagellar basal body rod protein FlgG
MRTGWTTLVCGIVLGGALGFVGGRIAVSARTAGASRGLVPWFSTTPSEAAAALPVASGDAPRLINEPVYFPEMPLTDSPAVHAQAFSGTVVIPGATDSQRSGGNAGEPAVLPGTEDAQPLSAHEDDEQRNIRRLIEAEMGNISAEDGEVWQDVLRGLPAEDALAILRLYRRFSDRAGSGEVFSSPIARMPRVPELPPLPRAPPTGDQSSLAADSPAAQLRRARSLHVHNLLNVWTPGFRRLQPLYADAGAGTGDVRDSAEGAAVRPGVHFVGTRIDLREGKHEVTGAAFDLAIRGAGFFVVRDGDERFYTRCGRFRLNAERRLVLGGGERELVLEPGITVPEGAPSVHVASDGTVTVGTDPPTRLGQIPLARFLDASGLVAAGRTLYLPGPASGPAQVASTGAAESPIMQGYLESSNVDAEREWELLRQLDELCKLVANPRP